MLNSEHSTKNIYSSIGSAAYDYGSIIKNEMHLFRYAREAEGKPTFYITEKYQDWIKGKLILAVCEIMEWLDLPDMNFSILSEEKPEGKIWNKDIFIFFSTLNNSLHVHAIGDSTLTAKLKGELSKRVIIKTSGTILWHYIDSSGQHTQESIELSHDYTVDDELYPYIPNGLTNFFERYRSHPASILILMGPPGTGKTSFIREYISRYNLSVSVTYDEALMAKDQFFIDYMVNPQQQLLVIEDADILLSSRESESNKTMSKLLNVSEGLIKLINKKIIFTTNLDKMSSFDPALLRPGRCYDVITFRKLNLQEANSIADKLKLERLTEKREYSLAEVFNRGTLSTKTRKIGII